MKPGYYIRVTSRGKTYLAIILHGVWAEEPFRWKTPSWFSTREKAETAMAKLARGPRYEVVEIGADGREAAADAGPEAP